LRGENVSLKKNENISPIKGIHNTLSKTYLLQPSHTSFIDALQKKNVLSDSYGAVIGLGDINFDRINHHFRLPHNTAVAGKRNSIFFLDLNNR